MDTAREPDVEVFLVRVPGRDQQRYGDGLRRIVQAEQLQGEQDRQGRLARTGAADDHQALGGQSPEAGGEVGEAGGAAGHVCADVLTVVCDRPVGPPAHRQPGASGQAQGPRLVPPLGEHHPCQFDGGAVRRRRRRRQMQVHVAEVPALDHICRTATGEHIVHIALCLL